MTKTERIEHIRTYVKRQKSATIQEIACSLNVSHMTVRRDLLSLPPHDSLKIIHGGVLYREEESEHKDRYTLLQARTNRFDQKKRIAQKAITLLEPEDIIIIDAGSTGELIATFLPEDIPLTVICYALNIASVVSSKSNCSLIVTGGYYHHSSMVLESNEGLTLLKQNRAHKTFITASGVNLSLGITCSNFFERNTKQTALNSASTKILVADSSKFGVVKTGHFADIDDFDTIITDSELPDDIRHSLKAQKGVTLYCV